MLLFSVCSIAHAGVLDDFYGIPATYWDEDYFADCKLKHIKPGMDTKAISSIESSCKHKATPQKCRDNKTAACLAECKNAGYWSNKFGDCSKD